MADDSRLTDFGIGKREDSEGNLEDESGLAEGEVAVEGKLDENAADTAETTATSQPEPWSGSGSESESGSDSDSSADADSESARATVTYTWTPDGTCDRCGTPASRRWRSSDGGGDSDSELGAFVCEPCKGW